MLIDWFTVVAQIVNFLVLVALLKHFLWGRLLRAIDEREKRVAGRLAEAEEKNKEAERQVEVTNARALEQERQSDAMVLQAQREADEKRDEMIRKAREAVRGLEAKWHEDLDRERQAFLDEIRHRAATEILSITKRALADLACVDVQHCAVQVFLEKLQTFDAATLHDLVNHELTVVSALDLPKETQQQIQETLEKRLGSEVQLQFERRPSMAWGLELRGNGRRIGWNSETYIESLEENLKEALEHQAEMVVG